MISVGIDPALAKFHACVTRFKKIKVKERLPYKTVKGLATSIKFYIPNLQPSYFQEFSIDKNYIDYYRYYIQEKVVKKIINREKPDVAVIESPAYNQSSQRRMQFSYVYEMCYRLFFERKIPVIKLEPTAMKYYAGASMSGKETLSIVQERYSFIENDDQAESFILSCYGFSNYYSYPFKKFRKSILCDLVDDSIFVQTFKTRKRKKNV
jgi:hypothetical protein